MSALLGVISSSKPTLNATVVGSPTISKDFIVSGFDPNSYLLIPFNNNSDSFELQIKFQRYQDSPTFTDVLIAGTIALGFTSRWWLWCLNIDTGSLSYSYSDYNKWIWVRIKYTKATNNLLIKFSYTGRFVGEEVTMFNSSLNSVLNILRIAFGGGGGGGDREYMVGEIDMKECWIKSLDGTQTFWKGVI